MNTPIRLLSIICLSVLFSACSSGSGGSGDSNDNPTSGGQAVTLSWDTPSERANGDPLPLSEIGGYEVYYIEDNATQGTGEVIRITTADSTEITISGLTPGTTYHFAISSYDTAGAYSDLSEYVTATIPSTL